MHGGCVAEGDVLAHIVAVEHHPRPIGGAFGGETIGRPVDGGDAPAVAVADLVRRRAGPMPAAGADLDGGVIVATHDQIADTDELVAGAAHGGPVGGGHTRAEAPAAGA